MIVTDLHDCARRCLILPEGTFVFKAGRLIETRRDFIGLVKWFTLSWPSILIIYGAIAAANTWRQIRPIHAWNFGGFDALAECY